MGQDHEDLHTELSRLKGEFVAERSTRKTRDDQIFNRIERIESDVDRQHQTMADMEESLGEDIDQVDGSLQEIKELNERMEGQVTLIKILAPIFAFLISALVSLAGYILHTDRIKDQKQLRKRIDQLEETVVNSHHSPSE